MQVMAEALQNFTSALSPMKPAESVKRNVRTLSPGTMEIQFPKGILRMVGSVDVVALRAAPDGLAK
ncbi:MAG: hypothetical protein DMG38_04645 [Acidobacteria bacterium]|nr:MAG: hypothetical protein DMG38_04645 [Acidobacteriota bacterium]